MDNAGNLFIADLFKIRRVDAVDGTIATVAGNGGAAFAGDGGSATAARIGFAQGVAIDANKNLYLSDQLGNRIRTVHLVPTQTVTGTFINFGTQLLNTSSVPQTITLGNTGLDSLIITSITSSDTTNFFSTNTCPGLQVAPQQTCTVRLTFTPVLAATIPTTITITTNDATNPVTVFNIQGTGTTAGTPILSFNPPAVSFGPAALPKIIIKDANGTDPNTLGFMGAFGGTAPGSAINGAWNIPAGPWNINYAQYNLTTANLADINASAGYTFTATFNNLSTNTLPTYPGAPYSYGENANLGVNNLRYDLGIFSDGQGNQVLDLNPFSANSPLYTIPGLGMNPVTLTLVFNNTTQLGDAYVNGVKVITGYAGDNDTFLCNCVVFGGELGSFTNVELRTGLPHRRHHQRHHYHQCRSRPTELHRPSRRHRRRPGRLHHRPQLYLCRRHSRSRRQLLRHQRRLHAFCLRPAHRHAHAHRQCLARNPNRGTLRHGLCRHRPGGHPQPAICYFRPYRSQHHRLIHRHPYQFGKRPAEFLRAPGHHRHGLYGLRHCQRLHLRGGCGSRAECFVHHRRILHAHPDRQQHRRPDIHRQRHSRHAKTSRFPAAASPAAPSPSRRPRIPSS